MKLLIALALLSFASAGPVTVHEPRNQNDRHYNLPTTIIPSFYDVQLIIDPDFHANFIGTVSIRIVPNTNTNVITLHAMAMSISSISVISALFESVNLFSSYTLATDDTHFLTITTNETLNALQPYTLEISYTAHYAENMFGVYVSTYEENGNTINLVTSQLQPTFARRAFPCFDEPALKAVFRTTIYAPPKFTEVRSNMPHRADLLKPDITGFTKHEFQDTLPMSTYLIAYLVSNLNYIENTASSRIYNIPFRVYARPNAIDTTDFAMDFGQKSMMALEEFTDMLYKFPKMDKVAVPDFAAGAMENWGLVIYREVALLVQPGLTTTSSLQSVGRIITHENVHQWFGNEVGPYSWTYTWLNEGFANFFESFATDLVLPQWRLTDQSVVTMQSTFQFDAVLTTNPMTFEVNTPSQILGTFNAIAYQKSGSVIRMMQHFLTPEVFKRGLQIYLRQNMRGAALPSNLYSALQQALDESNHAIPFSVATIMDGWEYQGGFPVLTVTKTSPSSDSVTIVQQRYLTDTTLSSNTVWYVPVNWALSTNPDFTTTAPEDWLRPTYSTSINIPGLSQAEWFIVNKQQTGYYRVNYERENWNALSKVLHSSHQTIHYLNRAQLIDDSFNLARNGRLDYSIPFELSRYLSDESDYIPWATANMAFTFLNSVLRGAPVYSYFQRYILDLTASTYNAIGFIASPTEEHVTAFHRNIVLNLNCLHGNEDCVNQASSLLENFRNNPAATINPDIQTTVFCSGLRGGSYDNFMFLWNRYLASQDSSEQNVLLNAMGCTSNAERRDFFLNQVIDENSAVREQDRHTILVSAINSGPENMEVAFDFIIENFIQIQNNVQGLTGTTNILSALSNTLTTQEHANKIEDFAVRYQNDFSAGERAAINRIRENIHAAIDWQTTNLAIVESWLHNYHSSSSSAISAGFTIFLALFALFFSNV